MNRVGTEIFWKKRREGTGNLGREGQEQETLVKDRGSGLYENGGKQGNFGRLKEEEQASQMKRKEQGD